MFIKLISMLTLLNYISGPRPPSKSLTEFLPFGSKHASWSLFSVFLVFTRFHSALPIGFPRSKTRSNRERKKTVLYASYQTLRLDIVYPLYEMHSELSTVLREYLEKGKQHFICRFITALDFNRQRLDSVELRCLLSESSDVDSLCAGDSYIHS